VVEQQQAGGQHRRHVEAAAPELVGEWEAARLERVVVREPGGCRLYVYRATATGADGAQRGRNRLTHPGSDLLHSYAMIDHV
jgi:hypothetical protein